VESTQRVYGLGLSFVSARTNKRNHHQVAVLRSDQTSKALKDGRRLGRLGQRFVKGAKIMMKKRWWEAGERTDIKSNGTYEIWYSRREELEVITLELPSLMWMPYKHCAQSPSLQAYLQDLPGF
jgi:hypothetical protein